MTYASITGWGKCTPPAVLSNDDLSQILDTSDEWIQTRTGMRERRISHVSVAELATVACQHALAAAGKEAADVDLIIFGSTTFSQLCPNSASYVQRVLGASNAGCMDLNTACTSGMYALTVATSMIRAGSAHTVLVIGAEVISKIMDWRDRDVAILFGDGATALLLEPSDAKCGVLAESLGCYGDARDILDIKGWGINDAFQGRDLGLTEWTFEGREIFKLAVEGMYTACHRVLNKLELNLDDIKTLIPHQANLRIINALGKKLGVKPDKTYVNIERYANMSAATTTMALIEAVEEGRVKAGDLLLLPAFGAGLAWSAHIIQWPERTEPLGTSDAALPPCDKTGLELVRGYMEQQEKARSRA